MGGRRSDLTTQVKTRIVTLLACMTPLSEVRDTVKAEFGVDATVQTIAWYDPTIGRSTPLGKQWADLFHITRADYMAKVGRVPIAESVVRLRELQRIYDRELEADNLSAAKATLEQAAKEVGGAFTNRRELTGKDGRDLLPPAPPPDLSRLTTEQLREFERLTVIATSVLVTAERVELPEQTATTEG